MPSRSKKNKNKHKTKTKTIRFKESKCSPKKKTEILDFTCYTSSALHKLKDIWNFRHPDETINSNNPRHIWDKLRYFMNDTCESEMCWLRHQCIKHDVDKSLMGKMFAPFHPEEWKKNPQEWLTTVDIQKVMSQWEKADPRFKFLGPSPINYDTHQVFGECVWEDICKFDIKNMIKKNKTKIGLIFNLDEHTEPGSHWVAMYIDLNNKDIYFFDSYGDDIPDGLEKFTNMVKQQASKLNLEYEIKINKKRHQYSNSECGMYSLYFIIQLINGTPFETFQKQKVPDSKMIKLRKEYFNSL